jgi:hypothetical protein
MLACSAVFSWLNAQRLQAADAGVSRAWRLLALGWMAYFSGQLILAWYQLARGTDAPYPSAGDLFFLAAYPFFLAALFSFIKAYRGAGFGVGTERRENRLVAMAGAGCAVLAVPLLIPTARAETAPLETALNIAYPALDLMLVVPVIALVRMALAMRGGAMAGVWIALLAGFAFMCAGDVLFAYFSALGFKGLDPLVHTTYILSYGMVAEGARRQLAILS